MTFLEFAAQVLQDEKKPLTANEIWEIGAAKKIDEKLGSLGKTPWITVGARIYLDIRDNPKTQFVKASVKPTRFALKSFAATINIEKIEAEDEKKEAKRESAYKERDLHKYLSYFVYTRFAIYTKTIFHEESNKKKFSQWLHPDIVGVYFPQWEKEVLEFSPVTGNTNNGVRIFSYELKRILTFSNVRESFFQAVSNSSWAHESYLVAAEIDEDEEFLTELKRLSSSFGIGIIQLSVDDPDSSQVLFPSKQSETLDMETMNKLAEANPNFRDFLKRVKIDFNSNEIRKEQYDKIIVFE